MLRRLLYRGAASWTTETGDSGCDRGDKGAPVGGQNKLWWVVRDHFSAHPDVAGLIRNGCGVISPAGGAAAGKWRVAAKAVVGSDARPRNDNGPGALDRIQQGVGRARKEVLTHHGEGNGSFARSVNSHRWKQHA